MMGKQIGAGTSVPSKEYNGAGVSTPSSHYENGTKVPPPGYKQTKVGVIPEEWEVVKIGDYIKIKHGWAFKGEYFSDQGDYLLLTPGNFFEEGGFRLREGKEKFYIGEFPDEYLLQKDNIIVAMTEQGAGLLGSPALIPENNKFLHNQRLGLLDIQEKSLIYFKYLYYLFFTQRIRNQIASEATGTKVKHTSPKTISNIEIPLPPLKEQQKIAQILTTWDNAISKQEALIGAKEQLKKGLMQKLLSGEIRFVGFDGEWEEVRLGDITNIIMGQSPSSSAYNENKEGMPLIQGNADCKNRKTFPRMYTTEKTKVCKVGDIIMTVRAPVGAISKSYHEACIGRGVCAIRPKEENEFLYHYLLMYEERWEKYSQGSTFTAVNSNDIKSLKIKLPPKQEQQKIAQVLTTADKEIALLKEELEVLKEQKRGLMQRLLTGEVRV